MTDLPTTPNSTPSRPTSPALGPALSALLDSEGNPDAPIRQIAMDAKLYAEAKDALPALRAVAEDKAGEDGVRRVIGKRFEMFPQPQRSDEGWAAWWADYFDVLADVPLATLEAGMRAYVALPDSDFMPKPGRLRELAFTAPCRALTRLHRATRAVWEAEYVPREPIPEPTPEELAAEAAKREENRLAILELAEDFKAKAIPRSPKPALPYIGGIPDERGITPQMRELIARQQSR